MPGYCSVLMVGSATLAYLEAVHQRHELACARRLEFHDFLNGSVHIRVFLDRSIVPHS